MENLSEHVVKSTEEIKSLIKQGAHLRTTAATRMNVVCSLMLNAILKCMVTLILGK